MAFLIGDFHKSPGNPRKISHSSDTTLLADGDIVLYLDHILQWDHECLSLEQSIEWRGQGDSLCDAALLELFPNASDSVGVDLLLRLQSFAEQNPEGPARSFLNDVSKQPPADILASNEDVRRSHIFFLENSVQIMQALLHYSLAGGFSSPRITRTLRSVSYLVPQSSSFVSEASNERTFSRLLETFQFVLEVMGCISETPDISDLLPGGAGWASTIKVRMLHGIARRRTRQRWSTTYPGSTDTPINQEEMSATLASFSVVPLWTLKRLGLSPSPSDAQAYLSAWRHIGFYLAVSEKILISHFSEPIRADKFLASTAIHLFSPEDSADMKRLITPTVPILRAVSNRAPLKSSFEYNCALSRHLLGPGFADYLRIPPTSTWTLIKLHISLFTQKVPHLFARYYTRSGWAVKRREVMREAMVRSVRFALGRRKTTFRPRTSVDENSGGEFTDEVKSKEAIPPDLVGANRTVKMWKEMMWEMVAVCSFVGAVGAFGAWKALGAMKVYNDVVP